MATQTQNKNKNEFHFLSFYGGETGWGPRDKIKLIGKFFGFPNVKAIVSYIIANVNDGTGAQFERLYASSGLEDEHGSCADNLSTNHIYESFMETINQDLDGPNVMLVNAKEEFYSRMLREKQVKEEANCPRFYYKKHK